MSYLENPIRILQVVTIMRRGGLETMLMNYYRNIDRKKIQFDFLVHRSEKGDFDDEILSLGGTIYHVLPLTIKGIFNYLVTLDNFFKTHNNYQIVHVHNNAFGYFPIKAAKKYKIPIRIIHSHIAKVDNLNFKILIGNFLKTKLKHIATDFLACGQDAGKWLYGNNTEFIVLNNAIETEIFTTNVYISNKIKFDLNAENSLNIVNVSRFCSQKNHLFLLDIFSEILKINSKSKLFLVGEGELKYAIIDKIKVLGIQKNVFFLGLKSNVNEILQAMDVFLFPSFYEGLPVALVEAQAAGIKCFTSTGVPIESALVPGLVQFIPLEKSANEWAKLILNNSNYLKEDTSKFIIESGFDVKVNAKWLEKYYFNLNE